MEEVLDVYQATYDEKRPLICMDEASRQVLEDVTPPLPMKPGKPLRIDDKYERHEVRSLLLFYNPIAGWRRVGGVGAGKGAPGVEGVAGEPEEGRDEQNRRQGNPKAAGGFHRTGAPGRATCR